MPANLPKMTFKKGGKNVTPIDVIKINDEYIVAVYEGTLSPADILIKYRQKNGEWSRIRTPKHIHWVVDMLLKLQTRPAQTKQFLELLQTIWASTTGLTDSQDRDDLTIHTLINMYEDEMEKFNNLGSKGQYSIKFLITIMKLLTLQEKTNREDAYMFREILEALADDKIDIFKIVSQATQGRNRSN